MQVFIFKKRKRKMQVSSSPLPSWMLPYRRFGLQLVVTYRQQVQ